MRRRAVLVLAAALVIPSLAAPALAQNAVSSGVELKADPPEVLPLDIRNETQFTVVYRYLVPANSRPDTVVHLSVESKPDWLGIAHEEKILVPVKSTQQESRVNTTFAFYVKGDTVPPGLRPATVTMKVRAEENGQISEATNTFSWIIEADYLPAVDLEPDPSTVYLSSGEIERIEVTLSNEGNAPVLPSWRLLHKPSDTQANIAWSNTVIGAEPLGDNITQADLTILLKDQGSSWSQEHLRIEALYTPAIDPHAETYSSTVDLVVIKGAAGLVEAVAGVLGFIAVVTGGTWYLYRREDDPS